MSETEQRGTKTPKVRMRVDPRYGKQPGHGDDEPGGVVTLSAAGPGETGMSRYFLEAPELETALFFLKGTLRDLGSALGHQDERDQIASADYTPSWHSLDPNDETADIAVVTHHLDTLDATILDLCARVLRGQAFVYRDDRGRTMPLWQSHTQYGEGLRVYGGWASTMRSTLESMMWRIASLDLLRHQAFTYRDVALDLVRTGRYTWPVRTGEAKG